MSSIFNDSPEEIRSFAAERGGLVDNYKDLRTPDRNLAHEYLDLLSECYAGSENQKGERFSIHAQVCAAGLRNAFFKKRAGSLLILYDEGLMRLIDEVALLCVIAKFRGFKKFDLKDSFYFFGQKSWHKRARH